MLLTDDIISNFVDRVLAEKERIETEIDWTPPEPPPNPPFLGDNRLQWRQPSEVREQPPVISVDELRQQLPEKFREYIGRPMTPDFPMLLARINAGGGKTHSGVVAAQWAARQGMRVLWAAPNHDLYGELADLQAEDGSLIFDPSLWLHFQSITNPDYCKHHKSQREWLKRNYPAMSLCQQFCTMDNWIKQCPYRKQAHSKQPIVFGMHQHLTTGLATSGFDVVFVDELPLGSFVKKRIIPKQFINNGGEGQIGELMHVLSNLAHSCENGKVYRGKELFDWIGDFLRVIYADRQIIEKALPVVPMVSGPDDIKEQPYWYIMDFLWLSLKEHAAWERQWTNWAERIKIDGRGLHLLDRALPWEALPQRMIVLDATAEPDLYAQIFGQYKESEWVPREIEVYQPRIKRVGKLFQVVARMNGKNSLLESWYRKRKLARSSAEVEETPEDENQEPANQETASNQDASQNEQKPKRSPYTANAHKLLLQCQVIAKKYTGRVCIICHKDTRALFEPVFGVENVMHFGAVRGSNLFKNCECLIVAGTPGPNPSDVIEIAIALDRNRIDPFVYGGSERSLFVEREIEYQITAELREQHGGMVPYRRARGYWGEWQLQAIQDQLSKAEQVQNIHRPRLNSRYAEVWVMSGLPIDELLNDIWDEIPSEMSGFDWQETALIGPWLNECWQKGVEVGLHEIAALLGLKIETVRNRKLLLAVKNNEPERWDWENDPRFRGERGPKVQRLKPIDVGVDIKQ